MRLLVVGSGAVGQLLAWVGATGGASVTLVRRRRIEPPGPERVTVERPDGSRSTVTVTTTPSVEAVASGASVAPFDLAVLAVKQYDLPAALEALDVLPTLPCITVQNGIGAEAAAVAARPDAPLLAGSLTASVEPRPDGVVRWLRRGGLGVATVRGRVAPTGAELLAVARAAGVPGRAYRDAASMKWSKLVANLVGNATAAILDADPASVYADPALYLVERDQVREAFAVMEAMGFRPLNLPGAPVRLLGFATRLPPPLARRLLSRAVAGARGGKSPSLRLAMTAASAPAELLTSSSATRTEARWLYGPVVDAGAAHGVPVPVNTALLRILAEIEVDPDRRAFFRRQPDRLVGVIRGAPDAG